MTLSTTQASQPPAAIKLSDSYATAALFALIKIESDESVPVIRDGKEYVNRATGDAIDVANANAVSVDKKAITSLLSRLYFRQAQAKPISGCDFLWGQIERQADQSCL